MTAREIIEAIDDPSGLIHPEKHQAFARGEHPLAKNPAFPDYTPGEGERASNYEEALASRQWQKLLQKATQYIGVPLTRQALPLIQRKTIDALSIIGEAESDHREQIEALAIQLVFELPEFKSARQAYEDNQIKIEASLIDEPGGPSEDMLMSDEPEAQEPLRQERTPAEKQWMDKMIQRRHFTNALIQGSAVSNNYLFELGGPALDHIHPGLRKAYGVLITATELGYWMFPQDAVLQGARARTHVGNVRVDIEKPEDDNGGTPPVPGEQPEQQPQQQIPVVRATGLCLPVLIQEIIKGLTELASLSSLPRDPEERKEVIDKADLVDMEAWHMLLGPKLWDSFVEAVDAENERELTLHLYRYIQEMDVDQFNNFMKQVLGKTPQGMQMLRELANRVRADMADDQNFNESRVILRQVLDN